MNFLMETLARTLDAMAAPNTKTVKTVRILQYLLEGFPIPATCNEFVLSNARTNRDGEPFHQIIVVSQVQELGCPFNWYERYLGCSLGGQDVD